MSQIDIVTLLRNALAANAAPQEQDPDRDPVQTDAAQAGADAFHAFRKATGCGHMGAWRQWSQEDRHGKERRAAILRAFRGGYVRSIDGKGKGAKGRAHSAFTWSPVLKGLADSLREMQPVKVAPKDDAIPGMDTDTDLLTAFLSLLQGDTSPAPTQRPDVQPVRRPWLVAMNGIRRAYVFAGIESAPTVGKSHPVYMDALEMAQDGHDADSIGATFADDPRIVGKGRKARGK